MILEQIAHIQELDQEDWAFDVSEGSEMGMEGSEEEGGTEESGLQKGNGLQEKVDKGKGKEKADDGKKDGKKDRNEGGSRSGRADEETLQ